MRNRMFITVYTRAPNGPYLDPVNLIDNLKVEFFKVKFIIALPTAAMSSEWLRRLGFTDWKSLWTYWLHACCMAPYVNKHYCNIGRRIATVHLIILLSIVLLLPLSCVHILYSVCCSHIISAYCVLLESETKFCTYTKQQINLILSFVVGVRGWLRHYATSRTRLHCVTE
jgi:hypothetical protein